MIVEETDNSTLSCVPKEMEDKWPSMSQHASLSPSLGVSSTVGKASSEAGGTVAAFTACVCVNEKSSLSGPPRSTESLLS
ncbi:hypothetical protein EYF80_052861 [Liparis tanakae]|uniref:Uncharacterized protein n=1 Tax=Liparis tanakae TaxID=230148 RepID=A0A4Z2F6T4_9TELE|nr:hypothetical protein EYF80_052861 [Liparis tanakae]